MKVLKKVLLGVLSLACVATVSVGFSGCQSDATDGLIYYPLSDGTYAVAQGTAKYLEEIVIPSTYKGKAVTMIADSAFEKSYVQSITIPDSVISIGEYAFYECSQLTEIVIPDGVESIEPYVFYGCRNLTKVVIPGSVRSIKKMAFDGCESIESVYYIGPASDWQSIEIGYNNWWLELGKVYVVV